MSDQPLTRIAASLGPDEVAGRSFPVTRRGFDQDAVRRFLEEAAGAIRDLREREADIGARLVEAERRAASPVLDEETLTAAVGAETAKVLRTAHEAARDVIARAEARAAELVTEAGGVLAERTREAEAEARALSARARAEAAALLESTTAECRAMVDEAREARRRILADLAERRRGLHLQLEQLRAGKDALVEVVDATARSVDDVRGRLADAEAYARVAADRVGDGAYGHDDVTLDGLLEEARSLPTVENGEAAEIDVEVADAVPPDGATRRSRSAAPANAVDDLFAKLRAARTTAPASTGGPADEAAAVAAEAPPVLDEDRAGPDAAGPDRAGPDGVSDDEAHAAPVSDADADVLARRDEVVAPVHAELSRVVKRELRSGQNELLDALRNLVRGAATDDLIPGDDAAGRLAASATPALLAAWCAGEQAAGGSQSSEAGEVGGDAAAVAARELAEAVVSSIRRRLDGALARAEDIAASTEVVGAAYREWRGERVEDLVSDYLARAYAEGVLAGAGEDAHVRWVVDDGADHCPDCDDNALAGPLRSGEAFPTGQVHPPVHAGCRCLLVVSRD